MKRLIWSGWIFLIALTCSCKKSSGPAIIEPTQPVAVNPDFVKGADVSWVTEMESTGYKFYNSNGTQQDVMQVLKDKGMNTIRLRAWVNPTNGWCNTADVVNKAARAKALGMKLMIDLHYSDTWADPGHQVKPAAWSALSFSNLTIAVHDYTVNVMNALKAKGITPDWVQVGNETNDGMLWPDGQASKNMSNFAALVNAGYNGVKEVSSSSKVIVHLSNGYDNSLFRWMFDGLKANNAKWDIIGMSLYPSTSNYQSYDTQCLSNINDMVSRYGTPVMICEIGMDVTQPATTKAFITDLIAKVRSVTNNNGLGVLYWEPECYNNWNGYTLGAFDNTGKPTSALDAFGN